MTQEEIERRCEDAVTHTGDKTMSVVVMLLAGLEYDIHEWIHNGQSNLDELELLRGQRGLRGSSAYAVPVRQRSRTAPAHSSARSNSHVCLLLRSTSC